MNIEELKQQAKEEAAYQEKIAELQAKAVSDFESFFEISKKSASLWEAKRKAAIEKLVEDFCEYFEQNEFQIEKSNNLFNYGDIKATYEAMTFTLSDVNYESEKMYFTNHQDVKEEIWIALPRDLPNYFVWKDLIVIGKTRLVDMYGSNASATDVYKKFVMKFNTEEELHQLIKKINVNIAHFQESIEKHGDTKLCIHRFNTDDTYDNFKSFINAVE